MTRFKTATHSTLIASLSILLLMGAAIPAQAFQFSITDKNTSSAGAGAALLNQAMNDLEASVNSSFTPGMEDNFIKSMAEAARNTSSSQG